MISRTEAQRKKSAREIFCERRRGGGTPGVWVTRDHCQEEYSKARLDGGWEKKKKGEIKDNGAGRVPRDEENLKKSRHQEAKSRIDLGTR